MKPFILLLLLAPAACATLPPAEADSYRALGTEPFWSITIANGRMTYASPDGGFSVPAPRGQETGAGRSWETRRLKLNMWHSECSDGMSDNRYPQTVRAVVDGRTLNGCGGTPVAGGSPEGGHWSMLAIDDDLVSGGDYFIEFGSGRLSGRAGCNRFSGTYSITGDRLSVGPLMATRMACPEPRMRHEHRVLEILRGPVTMRRQGGVGLVLTGNGGSIRLGQVH